MASLKGDLLDDLQANPLITGIPLLIYLLTALTMGSLIRPLKITLSPLIWPPLNTVALIALGACPPFYNRIRSGFLLADTNPWYFTFLTLFIFKFLKAFVHLISYFFLSSARSPPEVPTIIPQDVTVIIPSIGDFGDEFLECVRSIVNNCPRQIIISTVGTVKFVHARRVCQSFLRSRRLPATYIVVVAIAEASKRSQVIHAVNMTTSDIIAYADDHVRWPPTFLRSVLSEFEDPMVGLVGTVKRVYRDHGESWSDSFRNFIATIYLTRHNYECTASYNIDGGVFVISARTGLIRTDIAQNLEFRQGFLNETFLGVGPMNVDDDNFITRYMVRHGWKTVFHNRREGCIATTLGSEGDWNKFWGQLLCWARTTWRSNLKSMFVDGQCWTRHPWTSYAMFISSFVNIAIIYDPLLFWTLYKSGYGSEQAYKWLGALLLASKMVKPWPAYAANWTDIRMLFPAMLFSYFHGLLRLYALITMRNVAWAGRKLPGQ